MQGPLAAIWVKRKAPENILALFLYGVFPADIRFCKDSWKKQFKPFNLRL
jgi:hypothetical protein